MTAPTPFDWTEAGARLAESLDHLHAIAVLGDDADATARAALGIARAQAARRRVALGDLIGDAPPIQALVSEPDAHGIVDSFVYGVSLNRIAHAVPGIAELYVMPTGTDTLDPAEIFPNTRWRRLASGFREMGALLVLAAPANAPEVAALVAQLDGAVIVGDALPSDLPVAAVLSRVRRPLARNAEVVGAGANAATATGAVAAETAPTRSRSIAGRVIGGGILAAAIGGIGVWLAMRPMADTPDPAGRNRPDAAAGVAAVVPGTTPRDSAGAPADTVATPPAVTNPADSLMAAAYAVELAATNTIGGAAARVREERALPVATFAPTLVGGAPWYRVLVGAFAASAPADSLLASLRGRGRLDARSGGVVRAPYAFLVHRGIPADSVRALVGAYGDLGQPAYALVQADGTTHVYIGAFESPAQAALHVASLRAAGITPALAFRTGRAF